ncbi:hypothetical protein [Anaerococcus sp. AGMB09787]|uniref:hypothetical protein n=1 Tax=Anaerococcus sp. AGMB09787 TaxID=2922869 RepID=UPI001FAF7861|nr:hypothetical protein [Anaerococcus sp. AGMB09787]
MKKIICGFLLLLGLTSCSFMSREDFEEGVKKEQDLEIEDISMPEITYKETGKTDEKVNLDAFKDLKKADLGDGRDPSKAQGLIKTMKLDELDLAWVLTGNNLNLDLHFVSEGERYTKNFGSLLGDGHIGTTCHAFSFESDSGPMLMVNIVSLYKTHTKSAYYLYNRFLNTMDAFTFENSIENINPTVTRLNDLIEAGEEIVAGSLEEAIKERMASEEANLKPMVEAYGLTGEKLKTTYKNKEIESGNLVVYENPIDLLDINIKRDDKGSLIEIN